MLVIGSDLVRAESQICDLLIIVDKFADKTSQMAQYIVRLEALIEGMAMYLDHQGQVAEASALRESLDKIKKEYEL